MQDTKMHDFLVRRVGTTTPSIRSLSKRQIFSCKCTQLGQRRSFRLTALQQLGSRAKPARLAETPKKQVCIAELDCPMVYKADKCERSKLRCPNRNSESRRFHIATIKIAERRRNRNHAKSPLKSQLVIRIAAISNRWRVGFEIAGDLRRRRG